MAIMSAAALLGSFVYLLASPTHNDIYKYPLVNGRKPWSLFASKQKARFVTDARGVIDEGLKTVRIVYFVYRARI